MRVLLINADAVFNIAIRKLYNYYKGIATVEMRDYNLSFYSNNDHVYIGCKGYDKVYVSVIFDNSLSKIHLLDTDNVEIDIGGVGSNAPMKRLPDPIDRLEPYYYPNEKISYNFITRGCIRNCYFCKVRPSEGYIRLYKHPSEMDLKDITNFQDNNILAYDGHLDILKWLNDHTIKYRFQQGIDYRLTDDHNLKLLSEARYYKDLILAFDDISYLPSIEKKLGLIKEYYPVPFTTRWYVYYNRNMPIEDLIYRCKWLFDHDCLPYVMRDRNVYGMENESVVKDMASYYNQPQFCKSYTFETFLDKRFKDKERVEKSVRYYNHVVIQ